MKQKHYLVFEIVVICIILISGCIQENSTAKPDIMQCPTINLEATKDTGVIRIDKIISGNYQELKGIEEGSEITIEFDYSSRPAKIRMIPALEEPTSNSPEEPVSHIPTFAEPIPRENGYFIYNIETNLVVGEIEIILPGLEVGSKFRATISYCSPNMISVGKYEIIP
jgi:hypothetical protein